MNEMTPKQKLEWDTLGDGLCESATEVLVAVVPIGDLIVSLWRFNNEKGMTGYAIKFKHIDVLGHDGRIPKQEDALSIVRGLVWGHEQMATMHNDAVLRALQGTSH